MQIGEFAKACGTRISVLRHYDKEGLLIPAFTDRFTGYRHYKEDQILVFYWIQQLKETGFSLPEIRSVLYGNDGDLFSYLLAKKEIQLREQLLKLKELKERAPTMLNVRSGMLCLQENIKRSFETDDIVGRWEILGEYEKREDFQLCSNSNVEIPRDWGRELYFLPEGQFYWCFGWTKGMILYDDGVETICHSYQKETVNGIRYLFVDLKGYEYHLQGKTTVLVLRQIDDRTYSADEIARKDDLNYPFEEDPAVLGKWKAHSYCRRKEDFDPRRKGKEPLYFRSVEFLAEGRCISVYADEIFSEPEQQIWTKGILLRKWNHCACAYEIRKIEGVEYLLMEWKSGDYRWGGFDSDYYMFERE